MKREKRQKEREKNGKILKNAELTWVFNEWIHGL